MYQILTQEPASIDAKSTLVFFRRKDTKNKTWKESEKFRGVIVPSYTLPIAYHEQKEQVLSEATQDKGSEVEEEKTTISQAEDVFQDAIKDAFLNAASLILKEYVDSMQSATVIDEEMVSFTAVLERMQKESTSQRLNQTMIEAAYVGSKTAAAAITRYGSDTAGNKKSAALRSHYLSLASNNSGIMPDLASKMIAYIEADDLNDNTSNRSSIFAALIKKLEVLSKRDTSDDL